MDSNTIGATQGSSGAGVLRPSLDTLELMDADAAVPVVLEFPFRGRWQARNSPARRPVV